MNYCKNGGVCNATNDGCSCKKGFKGTFCTWEAEDLDTAQKLVVNTLSSLKGAVGEEDKDIALSSVSALTGDPDMINEEAADLALDVMSSATEDTEIEPKQAKDAIKSVSSIIAATYSKGHLGEGKTITKEKQKKRNALIMKVADNVLDSVTVSKGE